LFLGGRIRFQLGLLGHLLFAGIPPLVKGLLGGKTENDCGTEQVQPVGKNLLDQYPENGTGHFHRGQKEGHVVVDEWTRVVLRRHGIGFPIVVGGNVRCRGFSRGGSVATCRGGLNLGSKGMEVAQVEDQSTQGSPENTGLTQSTRRFGGKIQQNDPEWDVDPTTPDTACRCDPGGAEPDQHTDDISPQILGRRISFGGKDFAVETLLAGIVRVEIALAIKAIRNVLVSCLALGGRTLELS